MINDIPQFCIETFVNKFKTYPSLCLVEPPYTPDNFIEKSMKRYYTIWEVKKVLGSGEVIYSDVLLEYDPTGILFYIKDNSTIFILSKNDKSNIVDFTIHNLKKNK